MKGGEGGECGGGGEGRRERGINGVEESILRSLAAERWKSVAGGRGIHEVLEKVVFVVFWRLDSRVERVLRGVALARQGENKAGTGRSSGRVQIASQVPLYKRMVQINFNRTKLNPKLVETIGSVKRFVRS